MDAEIKVLSGENTELKCSNLRAWGRLVYKPYMLRLMPGISSFLIYILLVYSPAFFVEPLLIFPVLAVANTCRPAE